jgi:hypothetical protein
LFFALSSGTTELGAIKFVSSILLPLRWAVAGLGGRSA